MFGQSVGQQFLRFGAGIQGEGLLDLPLLLHEGQVRIGDAVIAPQVCSS